MKKGKCSDGLAKLQKIKERLLEVIKGYYR